MCECAGCDVPQEIENCVDCMQVTVSGCMLAQQQVEIDSVQRTGFMGASPGVLAALPPSQQQMILQARPAAAVGAVVGGAAGAAAMYSAAGHPMAKPVPVTIGRAPAMGGC